MTATVEVKDENWKQRFAEKARKAKAENFERNFHALYGRRPSVHSIETLEGNYVHSKAVADKDWAILNATKEWGERYERMKREELGE
jgi:hypothetical protein